MKFKSFYWLPLFIAVVTGGCKKDNSTETLIGNWVQESDFEGVSRNDAVSFTIGKFGYVGTGYDGLNRLKDFWAYDSDKNYWIRIADLPGDARNSAIAFSINGKGYVGTGYSGTDKMKDFWEYDPATDQWTQKADFPGTARYGAVGFSIDNKGYMGTGYDGNYLKDFWEYDPGTDSWQQIVSVIGAKRRDAVAFVLNGKGYICTGINNGSYENDLSEYDPATGLWTEKRKIANVSDESYDNDYSIVRSNATAFVINGKAYITTGTNGSLLGDTWEYDPATDLWDKKTAFEGAARLDAVSFSLDGSRGFVATGRSTSYEFDDIWEFKPLDDYTSND